MSVPNRLAKRQRLERKRKRKHEVRLMRRQQERSVTAESFRFDVPTIIAGGHGTAPHGVKMSDVLAEFVEPYTGFAVGKEAYRRLLMLGMLAWNAAMATKATQEAMVDDVLRRGLTEPDEETLADGKEIVRQMIVRKQQYFAKYRRPIIDFLLDDDGDGYYLQVIYALT